jgi:hypothetical protein
MPERGNEVCVLYDSHRTEPFAARNFRAIAAALPQGCDLVFCHDGAKPAPKVAGHIVVVDPEEMFGRIPHRKGDRVIPGNPDLKLLAAAARLPAYQSFVRIEYDVMLGPDPHSGMAALVGLCGGADLAASFVRRRKAQDTWMWWPSLQPPPDGPPLADDDCRNAFLPVMVVSRRLLDAYETYLAAGWTGHYEALLPTVAHLEGLRIVDLARLDPPLVARPSFKARPLDVAALATAPFIHPVKNLAQANEIMDWLVAHAEGRSPPREPDVQPR